MSSTYDFPSATVGEDDKLKECLTEIMTWMREPDWTEEASLEWLMDWVNRRPLTALGMAAVLIPGGDVGTQHKTEGGK